MTDETPIPAPPTEASYPKAAAAATTKRRTRKPNRPDSDPYSSPPNSRRSSRGGGGGGDDVHFEGLADDLYHSTRSAMRSLRKESKTQSHWLLETVKDGDLWRPHSLLTPMLIMAIHPPLKKSLITSNVAVFVVAVILAWRGSGKPEDVLTTTAAYAVVLVVFVALSGPAPK